MSKELEQEVARLKNELEILAISDRQYRDNFAVQFNLMSDIAADYYKRLEAIILYCSKDKDLMWAKWITHLAKKTDDWRDA